MTCKSSQKTQNTKAWQTLPWSKNLQHCPVCIHLYVHFMSKLNVQRQCVFANNHESDLITSTTINPLGLRPYPSSTAPFPSTPTTFSNSHAEKLHVSPLSSKCENDIVPESVLINPIHLYNAWYPTLLVSKVTLLTVTHLWKSFSAFATHIIHEPHRNFADYIRKRHPFSAKTLLTPIHEGTDLPYPFPYLANGW